MIHAQGDIIGDRYEIIRYINEGGMQEVYEAFDQVLDRSVACKVPKNNSALKRFKRSAVVSARVNHPNVAKTLDYVEATDRAYLIEELVRGNDLQEGLLRRIEVLDPYLVAQILHYLSKGIAAAHETGVVHRDLKPSNILYEGGLRVATLKVSDFGIAKMASEEIADAVEGGSETITASKTVVGALPYMAPEVIEDPRTVAQSADIWSLGAMSFELLSGTPPYGTGLGAVPRILNAGEVGEPNFLKDAAQLRPLGMDILELIRSCMRRDPAERPSAKDIVNTCEQFCYAQSPRHEGVVARFIRRTNGFIKQQNGGDVFFHTASVYGPRVAVDDRVAFSKTLGGGADRAHPVIRLRTEN